MPSSAGIASVLARADAALATVGQLPPRAAFAREVRRIRRSEIVGSTALAGSRLAPHEVDALLDRGIALGGRPFTHYVLVRAYADGADWVASQRSLPAGDRRPLLLVEEIRSLHARASVGSGVIGGAWRLGNPPPSEGIVSPAAWLVAREITALVDRVARGPQGVPIALWLASFLARFARIAPFEDANGRTARLAANLLLRRLDMIPIVVAPRDRMRYDRALATAQATDPQELATFLATVFTRTITALTAVAGEDPLPLAPLRALAGDDYTALAKAAQRGRLRSVVRNGRYFTTPDWIAAYLTRASRPGRPSTRRTP